MKTWTVLSFTEDTYLVWPSFYFSALVKNSEREMSRAFA
jgi:hypothetical protein